MEEIDDGIQSVQAALGPNMMVAPFFRAPYLQITADLEQFLFKRDVMLWSIDIDPKDWRPQSPEDVVEHILTLLEAKRSGIVLLHDVQPHTSAAIPTVDLMGKGEAGATFTVTALNGKFDNLHVEARWPAGGNPA